MVQLSGKSTYDHKCMALSVNGAGTLDSLVVDEYVLGMYTSPVKCLCMDLLQLLPQLTPQLMPRQIFKTSQPMPGSM